MMIIILFLILFICFRKLILWLEDKERRDILSIYFGVPGSGKTTLAAWLVKNDLKHKRNVWSNVPITGAYQLDCDRDIGKHMICNGRVIIDEAGIEYNNREYKGFSKEATYFFKYHRHYQTAVDVFSQGYDDMDKKLRTLAQRLYVVKRSMIPFFIVRKEICKKIGINEMTKAICDEYFFDKGKTRWFFAPKVWKMFNTVSRKEFPKFDFKKW